MTLMPVSNILADGSSESNVGAGAVDLPPGVDVERLGGDVERLTGHVPHVTQGHVTDRAP